MARFSAVLADLFRYGGSMDYSIYDSHSIVRIDGFSGLRWYVVTMRQAKRLMPFADSNCSLSVLSRLYSFSKKEVNLV